MTQSAIGRLRLFVSAFICFRQSDPRHDGRFNFDSAKEFLPTLLIKTGSRMPIVHIPPQLRKLTGGQKTVPATGQTVRDVMADIERQFPGICARLLEDGQLRASLTMVVDREVSRLGMLHAVTSESEIFFLPAIGGG